MKMSKEKCGCVHGHDKGRETIKFCAEHQAENDATRKRWHEDYRRSQSDGLDKP
jgi:hypothetical protein